MAGIYGHSAFAEHSSDYASVHEVMQSLRLSCYEGTGTCLILQVTKLRPREVT